MTWRRLVISHSICRPLNLSYDTDADRCCLRSRPTLLDPGANRHQRGVIHICPDPEPRQHAARRLRRVPICCFTVKIALDLMGTTVGGSWVTAFGATSSLPDALANVPSQSALPTFVIVRCRLSAC